MKAFLYRSSYAPTNAAIRLSVRLSMSVPYHSSTNVHLGAMVRTLIGTYMLKIEHTGQHGRTAVRRKWPKRHEAVASVDSEAFARWQHHRYMPYRTAIVGEHIVSRRDILLKSLLRFFVD